MAHSKKYYRDFREHLETLEERGKLIRVKRQINKDAELMPLVRWQFRGLEEDQREAFLQMASIGALLINAVRPWPYTPVSLPKKEFMEKSKAIWEELGLPPLKPRMPWYGYNLGAWTKEDEEEAELAVRGDYFVTGKKQTGHRKKP